MAMSYETEPIGPFEDGATTKVISYKVNGVQYHEKISIDLQNADFGTSKGITRATSIIVPDVANGGYNSVYSVTEVDPDSAEGKIILNDQSGARGNAYLSAFNDSGGIFDKAANEDKTVAVENALLESGMLDEAKGTSSFNTATFPGAPVVEKVSDLGDDTVEIDAKLRPRDASMEMGNMGALKYPVDALYGNGEQDHLLIEAFRYQAPQAGNISQNQKTKSGAYSGALSAITGLKRGSNISKGGKEQSEGHCRLPIPNKLGVSNGVGWGEGRANAVEAGAFFQAMGQAQTFLGQNGPEGKWDVAGAVQDAFGATTTVIDQLGKDLDSQGQTGTVLSAMMAKLALSRLNINVDPAQFITRSTAQAVNPNLELLFSGPKLRNFTFAFQFAPNSRSDSAMVRKIIRWFKMGMAPTLESEQSIFLGSPRVFRLKYMNGNRRIKGLNLFKICALTACELDMSPEGMYQAYDDSNAVSMPARINMALSFTELTPILENDYHGNVDKNNASFADLGLTGASAIGGDDIGF